MTENLASARVTVGGLTFGQRRDDGTELIWSDMKGWFDPPPSTSSMEDREAGNGAVPGPLYYGRRTITLSGRIGCRTRGEAARMSQRLSGLLGDGGYYPFEVDDDDLGYLWTDVQRGDIKVDWPGRDWLDFQLGFVAPDHRRYGPLRTASTPMATDETGNLSDDGGLDDTGGLDAGGGAQPALVTVQNNGTVETPVRLVLRANSENIVGPVRVVEGRTSRELVYAGNIEASHHLVLDAGPSKAVLYDGYASRRDLLTRAQWPSIPPNGVQSSFTWEHAAGSLTSAQLEAVIADAYL